MLQLASVCFQRLSLLLHLLGPLLLLLKVLQGTYTGLHQNVILIDSLEWQARQRNSRYKGRAVVSLLDIRVCCQGGCPTLWRLRPTSVFCYI